MTVLRFLNAPAFALALLGVLPIPSFAAAGNIRVVAQVTLSTTEPAGVPNGILQQGIYVTAPIILDGTTLFRVATPANASVTQMPISARVIQVQTALAQLLAEDGTGSDAATLFSPKSIRVLHATCRRRRRTRSGRRETQRSATHRHGHLGRRPSAFSRREALDVLPVRTTPP